MAKNYIIIFGNNIFECLYLILWGWFNNRKLSVIFCPIFLKLRKALGKVFFLRAYLKESIAEYKTDISEHKGLWYRMNSETTDITLQFYKQKIEKKGRVISYYNKFFRTDKFEAYIKRMISYQVVNLLKKIHPIRLTGADNLCIIMPGDPVSKFVVEYIENKYKINYRIKWIMPLWRILYLSVYYCWLFTEFIRRGVVFNKKRKRYKLSKEVAWGFHQLTFKDDMVIDDNEFQKEDLLLLLFNPKNHKRARIFKEARDRGFGTASVASLKININKNIFNLLFSYIFLPFRAGICLFLNRQLYLSYYIFLFHKQIFPMEVLINLYNIGCFISVRDHGDLPETIMLNKYGTKTALFQWSDLTVFKAYDYAFTAHNIYFSWGDIHYDYHSANYFVDRRVNTGCMFKEAYSRATKNKENVLSRIAKFKKGEKIVSFFDTSFNNVYLTDSFLLDYLELISEFCKNNPNLNVLLKPKNEEDYQDRISPARQERFKKVWVRLAGFDNFTYLDALQWSIEEIIAISDVCINMGINSPSTIALICGVNALYFDTTGNIYHPFARKYSDVIVFNDCQRLFQQIGNILQGRFNCRDIVDEREIRQYDAFADEDALGRIRNNLYETTLT